MLYRLLTVLGLLAATAAHGQSGPDSTEAPRPRTFQEEYEAFRDHARKEYENFRDRANKEYAEFMGQAWRESKLLPAIPRPKERDVPPRVMPEEDRGKPVESRPVPIKDTIVPPPPAPQPQPVPIAPIKEQQKPEEPHVSFTLYGTAFKVRFSQDERFSLRDCGKKSLAEAWLRLSGEAYNNTIRDCLEQRIEKQLSDWAYLRMLQKMAEACLGKGNEATLLMAYVYCQTGYKMRLGVAEGRLYMLYASQHEIFRQGYYEVDGERYYPLDSQAGEMGICNISFPQEQALSLLVQNEQLLAYAKTPPRTLKARDYPEMEITASVNKNAISFYGDYPTSMIGGNVMTRWAMYANAPLPKTLKQELLPAFRAKLNGLGQLQAVERLLNWVQTAFTYEYDDKVWGGDRAFFPEETLHYPYCDCEDRAILLSRLIRDLLGLKCILVFYPGHLAMATHFTEDVKGDYILLNNKRYTICDPTYIGAPVGVTMPKMDNATAQVILLE